MINIFVKIGEGVEVAADDFVKFCEDVKLEGQAILSPRAMIALAILIGAAIPVATDVAAAIAQDGLNVPLDMETASLLIALMPDLKAYANTLTIQPVKGTKS